MVGLYLLLQQTYFPQRPLWFELLLLTLLLQYSPQQKVIPFQLLLLSYLRLMVDYLDLMMPISQKVSGGDLFIKDKYVSEELRNLAVERDLLFVTASQLNRGAVEEIEFDHHHIAGGISKVQTADNLVGIFTSNAMREKGRYQIQFMKTRSSSGVGTKVDLRFDPDTLRIEDLQEGDEDAMTMTTSSLVQDLQRRNSIKADEPEAQDVITGAMNMREFFKKNDQ